jgi:hypothetical protein
MEVTIAVKSDLGRSRVEDGIHAPPRHCEWVQRERHRCYGLPMQKQKPKWRADRTTRALKTINEIEASIVALHDEDLLDLHDIFAAAASSALDMLALNEMRRRGLSM